MSRNYCLYRDSLFMGRFLTAMGAKAYAMKHIAGHTWRVVDTSTLKLIWEA